MVADFTAVNSSQLHKLGNFIRRQRHGLGLTQAQLAERVGWTQERVSVLETGTYGMPSLPSLSHLASSLDSSLFTMLTAAGFGDDSIAYAVPADPSEHSGAVLLRMIRRLLAIEASSLSEALDQASDLVAEVLSADKVDAFILEEHSNTLIALGSSNTPMGRKQFAIGMDRMPIANGGREVQVFQTGESYRTGRARDDPGMLHGVTEGLGVQSLLTVPLDVAGSRRGVLLAESTRIDLYTEDDLSFLQTVATFVGVAAERAERSEQAAADLLLSARRMAAEELLTILAHDLRNRLTPLKAYVIVIAQRAKHEGRADYLKSAKGAERSILHIEHMLQDQLDVARLERGIFSIEAQPVDFVMLVRDVVATLLPEGYPVDLQLPDDLVGYADPFRLRQALENLVANAMQHSPRKGVVTVQLLHEARDHANWVVLRVTDQGPGIPPELVPILFDRFTKGNKSNGLGLGLYLARGIVEAHGGTLVAGLEKSTGSTMYLSLPIDPPDPE